MIKLLAALTLALVVAMPAEAMTPARISQPDDMIARVGWACGMGKIRVNSVCVPRTMILQNRRCLRWHAGVCVHYY